MSDVRLARVARMLDDPELHGDLLLVGVGFARFLDFGLPPDQRLSTGRVAKAVFPRNRQRGWKIKQVIADDARTYQPPWPHYHERSGCVAPMIRRDGACGRNGTTCGHITDWDTGEMQFIEACARHREWYETTTRDNRAARPTRLTVPAANHGGILARHIPEFAWPKIWEWATDGRWVEHPEVDPWKPPTFTLVLGDGDAGGGGQRPMLTPVGAS